MARHPIEALLRPPAELTAGGIALCCAGVAWLGPHYLMVTPVVGQGSAVMMASVGLWWMAKGYHVVRYQQNLRRLKHFWMTSRATPVSRRWLYLGRGFRWTEKHTQRLHDTRRTRMQVFVQPNALWRWVRENEYRWQESVLYRLTRWDSPFNPLRPLPPVGGNTVLHGVELKERNIHMPLQDRNGHTIILGATQVGKTRALELFSRQDIVRGDIVIVFDPKGDAELLRSMVESCQDAGRMDDFYFFHLGHPDFSVRYNGVGHFQRVTEVATRISGQLSGEGQSAVFREFAWRFTNIVAKAVVALGDRPVYRTILKHVTNIDELFSQYADHYFADDAEVMAHIDHLLRTIKPDKQMRHMQGREPRVIAWENFLMSSGRGDDVIDGLRSAFKYEKSYFDKIVASLLPLLEKLTTGKTAELLSPDYLKLDDDRPILDWKKVINQRGVVYIGLDALSDTDVAGAVGSSLFADLVSYAGERYKHGDTQGFRHEAAQEQLPIVVHGDEMNELMGDEFIPMVNKGGAAGIQINAYTQTVSDVVVKLRSEAKAKQVIGNFNNLIMFRVKEKETAAMLTDQLPGVKVHDMTLISGYNDSSDPDSEVDFTSRHEDRITTETVSMLEPHDVMNLPKGQAFALLEGGHLYKIRLPLLKKSRRQVSASFDEITQDMRKRYRTSSTWWLSEQSVLGAG